VSASVPDRVRRHLPADWEVTAHHDGEQARVWRATSGTACIWIKQHRHAANAHREATALAAVADLAPGVPRMLDHPSPDTLLLSAVAGQPLADALPSGPRRAAAMAQLGGWLRALAACPPPPADAVDADVAYAARFRGWCAGADEALRPRDRARVLHGFDPDVFAGAPRRWCHRDLTLHNVLLDPAGNVGVIDFGQARPDVWPVDLVKLWADPTLDAEDRGQLLAGYGIPLSGDDAARLRHALVVHAVATLGWGVRHRQAARIAEGHALLDRLADGAFVSAGRTGAAQHVGERSE
jgi:Ser/Thr protein kinase RdoA (MazF antagonist)